MGPAEPGIDIVHRLACGGWRAARRLAAAEAAP